MAIARGQEGKELLQTIAFTLWHIWKERNDATFKDNEPLALGVIQKVRGALMEFKHLKMLSQQERSTGSVLQQKIATKWEAPAEGMVKINCDGSVEKDTWAVGLGGVARSHTGDLIGGFSKKTLSSSIEITGMSALLEGMKLAKEKTWKNIIL